MSDKQLRRRVVRLLVAFAVIVACSWLKARENRLDQQAQVAWQLRLEHLRAAGGAKYAKLKSDLKQWLDRPGSLHRVQTEWNGGQPLELAMEAGREVATWTDPTYNCRFTLTFKDDVLQGYRCSWGSGHLLAAYPQPPRLSQDSFVETVRRGVAGFAWCVWGLIFLPVLSRKRQHERDDTLLIAAVVAGAAWLVSPNYSLTWRGIFSNDPLFYAAIMLLVSIAIIALHTPPAVVDRGPRYSLKALLFVLTTAAVLLALGPIGYVTVAVILLGLVWFVGVNRFLHPHLHPTTTGRTT